MGNFGVRHFIILTLGAMAGNAPAFGAVVFTCDTASFAANAPAGTCNALNGSSVAGVYNGIFSNATAKIFIQYAGSGLAGSSFNLNSVSYSSYLAALSSHEGDANDVTAVSTLPNTEPAVYGGIDVAITSALGLALGLTHTAGIDASGNSCALANNGCYDGVISIGASANPVYYPLSPSDPTSAGWDFFMLVEHETDEILGSISCIGTDPNNNTLASNQCVDSNGTTFVAPADLFRYSAPGTLSFLNHANGGSAYFSINGGVTNIANYVNMPNIGDFGDWSGTCFVQNYSACQSTNADISNDGGSEIAVLDAVGFNLNSQAVPEPGTWGLLGASLTFLAFARSRRR